VGRPSNGWQRPFEDPIELPDGHTLITLRDAADYITALPKKEAELPAIEVLLLVSRGGPTMMARIGFMQALHRTWCGSSRPRKSRPIGPSGNSSETSELGPPQSAYSEFQIKF
jgi:hypothetical protein